MASMIHPNIVHLYGVVIEDVPTPWIVLEYLPHCDLKSYLKVYKIPLYLCSCHCILEISSEASRSIDKIYDRYCYGYALPCTMWTNSQSELCRIMKL